MIPKITFITSNLGKVDEVSRFLGIPIDHVSLDIPEIQSLDLEEIVKDKAERAYAELQKPVLVEDSSLVFTDLGKLPGPLIKWFLQELGNEGLCRLLDGKDRSCVATVVYGYHDGKTVHFFEGAMAEGTVAQHPRGDGSFGWSAIFIPPGMDKTYAELSVDEQKTIAMRRIALEKLQAFL